MSRFYRRGFTLVEMLVVIGIVAVLAALLLPAVMSAITRARNTVIALEINQLASAIEAYRLEKGDYPPNFRDVDVVRRHITKCYPKIDQAYFLAFMQRAFPVNSGVPVNPTPPSNGSAGTVKIDESESLVFWLSMTDTNPNFPFLSFMQPPTATSPLTVNAKRYYDFDETRLSNTASPDVKSFKAKFCQDTFYLYIDSRSYDKPATDITDVCRFNAVDGSTPGDTYAYAEDSASGVRPYWSNTKNPNASLTPKLTYRDGYKPMNATTFQLICAGQDGDFGFALADPDVKVFPLGLNYNDGDKDNITNFSNGKTLKDNIP